MFKDRRGDEVPFEEYTLVMLSGIVLPKSLMGQGKRRPAEQGLLGFPACVKRLCGSLTRAWFLDDCNSSHFSGFISNSFNVIVKKNRHKVCFGAAHCVASLSSKLPIARFFQMDASASPIQTKIACMCLMLKLNEKCDATSLLPTHQLKS